MCERFAEEATYGKSGMYGSAADAWDNYAQSGKAYQGNIQEAPSGALIYFAPDNSNGGFGHVGVADGKGNMISATYNGVQASNIDDWIKNTGQTPLGFVKP
jgi:cell wall-associated NlpC family hydrolase